MGNILSAEVTIKGSRPLWFHRFGPEALPLEKQEKMGVAGNDPSEWRRTALVTRDGQLFVDATYIFGCIKEGGRFVPKKRGSIMPDIAATLQAIDDRVLIDRWLPGFPNGHACDLAKVDVPPTDPEESVYLDVRGVRNPSTKARNVRYRIATRPGWSATFHIQWDKTVVARGPMEAAINEAGRLVGIGNGRAVGMGRFTVESFDVTE